MRLRRLHVTCIAACAIGDEFLLDQRVDETSEELTVGFEHAWKRATLVLEERYREFENDLEITLPEASVGLDPFDATGLDLYRWLGPHSFESHDHAIRLVARPTDRLRVRVAALWQELEMEVEGNEAGPNRVTAQEIRWEGKELDPGVYVYSLRLTEGGETTDHALGKFAILR